MSTSRSDFAVQATTTNHSTQVLCTVILTRRVDAKQPDVLQRSAVRGVRCASAITVDASGAMKVPDQPIIPFIEGDGTGPDIWKSSVRVFDAAVEKAYKGKKKIQVSSHRSGHSAFIPRLLSA